VEHRLQIEGSQQRHCLPTKPDELDAFARRLGYANGASFMNDYSDRADQTRRVLDQFLASEGSGNLWVTELLDPHSAGESGTARLRTLGFADAEAARAELLALYTGPRERPHSLHVRQQFLKVAPELLQALARAAGPDATLLRLGQILSNVRAPGVIYETLTLAPALCGHLVALVENSEFLADLLIRDPGLFETFGTSGALDRASTREDLDEQLRGLLRAFDTDAAPYRLHMGETLRIGMRDIIAGADVTDISRELTQLAEVCLAYAVGKARAKVVEKYGDASARFAVLALGKFAGRELGYGSDLDLVFVYEAGAPIECGMSPIEYFTAFASNIIKTLKEPTKYGLLYDVDARLRPDGNKGNLVVSDARLREYYLSEAQAWERLALIKVRAVGGDAAFGAKVEHDAASFAYTLPLTDENLDTIEDIRAKLAAASSPLSLKKSEGGMAELEFAVRLLQIANAAAHPGVAQGDALAALDALVGAGAVRTEDAALLRDTYLLFRRIENRLRVRDGRSTSVLPADAEDRQDLARRLGIDGDLLSLVESRKERVHRFYAAVLETLRGTS
ncbi:MAG: hypothetical protein FJY92_03825, partial [Candidatus Hydrogenedentes bacterium]|nr:hypothetical protein [Candidatus Hydrogenedentota bacterium]